MIAEHRHLVSQGAKLVELRLDYINGQINLKRLLAEKPCPVVITLRREIDGGKWRGSEDERLLVPTSSIGRSSSTSICGASDRSIRGSRDTSI